MRSTLGTHAEQCFNRGMRAWPYLLWSLCKDSLLGVVAGQAGHGGRAGHPDDQAGFRMQVSASLWVSGAAGPDRAQGAVCPTGCLLPPPSQTVGLGSSGQLSSVPCNPGAFPGPGLGSCPGGFVRGCCSSSMGTTREKTHFKNTLFVIPFGLFFFFWK